MTVKISIWAWKSSAKYLTHLQKWKRKKSSKMSLYLLTNCIYVLHMIYKIWGFWHLRKASERWGIRDFQWQTKQDEDSLDLDRHTQRYNWILQSNYMEMNKDMINHLNHSIKRKAHSDFTHMSRIFKSTKKQRQEVFQKLHN